MLGNALKKILLGNRYTGIELFDGGEGLMAAVILVRKRKEELDIESAQASIGEIFPKGWEKSHPCNIIINTAQVIQKEIAENDTVDERLFHKAFPGFPQQDFYCQIMHLPTKSLIAISRKDYIDQILLDFRKKEINVCGIGLGVCTVSSIIPFLGADSVETSQQTVSWSPHSPIICPRNKVNNSFCNLNGLEIKPENILAFAGILSLLSVNAGISGNIISQNNALADTYYQKVFFSKTLKTAVASLLFLLLVNFLFFNYYYKKSQEYSEKVMINKYEMDAARKIGNRLKIKEKRLIELNRKLDFKGSVIINEIAKTVPNSILLSEIEFNPLARKIEPEKPIESEDKTIMISGVTIDNLAFTDWTERVSHLKHVSQLVITHFGKDENNQVVFSIKLKLQ